MTQSMVTAEAAGANKREAADKGSHNDREKFCTRSPPERTPGRSAPFVLWEGYEKCSHRAQAKNLLGACFEIGLRRRVSKPLVKRPFCHSEKFRSTSLFVFREEAAGLIAPSNGPGRFAHGGGAYWCLRRALRHAGSLRLRGGVSLCLLECLGC